MASVLKQSLRISDQAICRRCANTSTRRTFASTSTQNPKHDLRSRPSIASSLPIRSRFASSLHNSRAFSTSRRLQKTVEEVKARQSTGPFSWTSGILFLAAGIGLTIYFRYEKARMARKKIADANKGMGKPLIGGPFHLKTQDGKDFTEEDLKGKYSLIYFGFTHCPDICPEELDKMAGMIERVKKTHGQDAMQSLFISCDPARDTPEVIAKYLSDFHPDIVGMTGTWQEVKDVCKVYRVYFSTPPEVQAGQDYLVDHSIYFYLMDPDGDFVEAIGRNFTEEAAAKVINDHVADWKGKVKKQW